MLRPWNKTFLSWKKKVTKKKVEKSRSSIWTKKESSNGCQLHVKMLPVPNETKQCHDKDEKNLQGVSKQQENCRRLWGTTFDNSVKTCKASFRVNPLSYIRGVATVTCIRNKWVFWGENCGHNNKVTVFTLWPYGGVLLH